MLPTAVICIDQPHLQSFRGILSSNSPNFYLYGCSSISCVVEDLAEYDLWEAPMKDSSLWRLACPEPTFALIFSSKTMKTHLNNLGSLWSESLTQEDRSTQQIWYLFPFEFENLFMHIPSLTKSFSTKSTNHILTPLPLLNFSYSVSHSLLPFSEIFRASFHLILLSYFE